jgi:hypothetical protein
MTKKQGAGRPRERLRSVSRDEEYEFLLAIREKKRKGRTTAQAHAELLVSPKYGRAADAVHTKWTDPDARRKAIERRLQTLPKEERERDRETRFGRARILLDLEHPELAGNFSEEDLRRLAERAKKGFERSPNGSSDTLEFQTPAEKIALAVLVREKALDSKAADPEREERFLRRGQSRMTDDDGNPVY